MSIPVTIAVVSWNTRGPLAACLKSMRTDVEAARAEVWVIDNGSSDGSVDMVRERFPWAHVIVADGNLGFGPAVNVVAQRTSTPWLAAANADIELTPGALGTLLEAGETDHGAGGLAPQLILPDGTSQHSVHSFPTATAAIATNLRLPKLLPSLGRKLNAAGYLDTSAPRRVDWATGAFLLFRREAFAQAGGFDGAQWMYAEDIDLCWRLRGAGWGTRYEPRAKVLHALSAAATVAFGDQMEIRSIGAKYSWIARRRGVGPAWVVAAVNWIGALLRYALCTPFVSRGGRWPERQQEARLGIRVHRTGLRSRKALLER